MSQSDRAIKKLATDLARIKHEVVSWRGAQADFTSIENGGNFTFKDGDGNVTAIMGGQDDGSNTIRHVDGPTPPIPSGLSAHVDGPIVQVSWDGTFEDADTATWDWSHLEVVVVGPSNEQLTATINDVTGATANLAATVSGEWTVVARSVSRAEKRSLDGDAGTVDVELVGLTGAINDAIGSANGKNTVTYAEVPPTPADEGIAGDTWFVGSVADIPNPNNLALNAEFNTLQYQRSEGMAHASTGTSIDLSTDWFSSEPTSLKVTPIASNNTTAVDQMLRENPNTASDAGRTFTIAADVHLDSPQTGSLWTHPRRILVRTRYDGFTSSSWRYSDSAPNVAGTHRVKVTFTLPAGLEWWYFMLTNGSSTTPVYWDNLVIEEGTTDGLFWVTNENGSWNIVEQYRHNGSGWYSVELNHEVISSVDLGKATVGELDGARIMGQTIHGEQLSGDAIDGKVITGANIRTSSSGARVQMDVGGLRVFDASDDQMVQLPSDGTAATFNGELVAKSLTSTGRASFLADNNRLEPGAGLVLAAGVGDPPSPPVVSNHHKQITPPALVDGESVSGLAYGDGLFWRAVDAGAGNNGLDRVEGIDRNGVVQRTIPLLNFWARNGLAVVGDELFALGIRDDRPANVRNKERWVRVYGLDGTYKRQWEYPNYGTGTYQPGIGSTPAGNVSIAQCWQDGKLSWRSFTPTGSLINTTTRDAPVKSDAVGIYGGTADFGATRTVFAKGFTPGTNRQFTVYGSNGNDYFPEQSWYSPGRGDVKGLAWDGAKFYSIDTAGVITEYGSLNMGDDSANWWATYRWVGSGGKTTRIAPPARFAWARRSRVRVSAPNIPQGVTTIEPSLAFKVTTPARSDFTSPAWVAGDTPATVNYEVLDPYWYVGSPPGDINNFPNSTPSSVKAASGLFEVKGDGSGRWGPLTFNPDGSMSSSAVPAWVPITAFASGFSAGSFGFAPAYRVWPDGKVEWRGVVSGSFTGTNAATPFVIPVAARSTQPVSSVAACNIVNGGSEGHVRVEFCADDRPTQLSVYAAGKARSWFALDTLTYYKS